MPETFDEENPPERGTEAWREAVRYSMFAREFLPGESTEYYDLLITPEDVPERVYTVYRRDPENPESHIYITTLNMSGFKDTAELARHLGTLDTR